MRKLFSKIIFLVTFFNIHALLYPFESESRLKISLNGLWDFKVDFNNEGIQDNWQTKTFKNEVNLF